jgi:GH18 family chitinase
MEEGRIDAADVHEDVSQLLSAYASWSNPDGTRTWVGYDTVTTLKAKVCWARYLKLGGIMFWDADMDDEMEVISELRGFYDSPDCASIAGFSIPEECECLDAEQVQEAAEAAAARQSEDLGW